VSVTGIAVRAYPEDIERVCCAPAGELYCCWKFRAVHAYRTMGPSAPIKA